MSKAALRDTQSLADLPTSQRIDLVLATLSAMPRQKPGGWTTAELAELCECSESCIAKRTAEAVSKLRNKINRHHPALSREVTGQ